MIDRNSPVTEDELHAYVDDEIAADRRGAVEAWLAWQDGRPDEVLKLAAEIEQQNLSNVASGARYQWVYLFPVVAARLKADALDAAVGAARRILDPSQQLLSEDLMAALAAACAAWDNGDQATARSRLAAALDLARARGYF